MAAAGGDEEALLAALRSPGWRDRVAAAEALAGCEGASVRAALEACLDDGDTAVTQAVVESLWHRKDPKAVPALLRALDLEEGTGDQVLSALTILAQEDAAWFAAATAGVLRSPGETQLRVNAAETLGYPLAAETYVSLLRDTLDDDDEQVARAALDSIERLWPIAQRPEARRPPRKDPLAGAREFVIDCLGEGPIAFPELTESVVWECGVDPWEAITAARSTLASIIDGGPVTIQLGPALWDQEDVDERDAGAIVGSARYYVYGAGGEVRAWFTVPVTAV